MLETLPQSIWNELHAAQTKAAHLNRSLRVEANGKSFAILRLTAEGFVLAGMDAPQLRGTANLYDGARHLSRCEIVGSSVSRGETIYEFKRISDAKQSVAFDFERNADVPRALLGL